MSFLKSKDKIPHFERKDILGKSVNSESFKGKKLLFCFFRGGCCSFGNLRVSELKANYSKLQEKNIEIVVFFADTPEEIANYAGKQNAPFSIIPDPNLEIYKKFNIQQSQSGMVKAMINPIKMFKVMRSEFFNWKSIRLRPLIPADFLVNEDQTIFRAHYANDFGDHLPINEILDWQKQ